MVGLVIMALAAIGITIAVVYAYTKPGPDQREIGPSAGM